jgi:hypothetical protein
MGWTTYSGSGYWLTILVNYETSDSAMCGLHVPQHGLLVVQPLFRQRAGWHVLATRQLKSYVKRI